MMTDILTIEDLRVSFAGRTGRDDREQVIHGVDIAVPAGASVGIVGESGSGKSQTFMAVMGLLASGGQARGRVFLQGQQVLGAPKHELNRFRGSRISMIFQEPMTSLHPQLRIGQQVAEPLVYHRGMGWRAALARAHEWLEMVEIPEPARRMRSYPHELSGGQRQRVMIAMALITEPKILIADEPTTALDVTIQAQILTLLARLQRQLGMALVLISHDLSIVRRLCGQVYVMNQGQVVEQGPSETILRHPSHAYTQMLIDSEPAGHKDPPAQDAPVVLRCAGVAVRFLLDRGFLQGRYFDAVRDVCFQLRKGQTLGIVGESGSGKSTLARALLRLYESQGEIEILGQAVQNLHPHKLGALRRRMQVVFQDPYGSLSPRLTTGEIIAEGLRVHQPELDHAAREARVCQALQDVQLDPEDRWCYPHEFSGGQRQRIAIARAMILRPDIVILDEPTSALDRSVQKWIIALLRDLQERYGLTYVFISHDLKVVRAMADTVLVMRQGKIVERGPTHQIFQSPQQEYTQRLMRAAMDERAFHQEMS
ncbi:MAG: dipeptide ABC transporter ATP-binding protein [Pseudomonadota bacterium]